jgi:hypothetical protein
MKPSNNASKLILSTALFTLAGSIVFVSGTGLALGATSTDKAISTLKSQIKSLQARVQTLEDSPELLQGEPGPEGPQGPQGERGEKGATGTMSGLRTQSITVWEKSYPICTSNLFSSFSALNSSTGISGGGLIKVCSSLSSSSVNVYVP